MFGNKSDTERKLYKIICKYNAVDMTKIHPSIEETIKGISMRKRQGFLAQVLTGFILKECVGIFRHESRENVI